MEQNKNQSVQVPIGTKTYSLMINYQEQKIYRTAFNRLIKNVFDLNLEPWYQSGYWRENYIPYTLFEGKQAVANASVNIMNFNVFGKDQCFIQLGTIATDEHYRKKGLSQFLIEHILNEWDTLCDFIYLFANPTAHNFYPKFGFEPVKEYLYYTTTVPQSGDEIFEKVDINLAFLREKLYEYIKVSTLFTCFSMQNADLVMFYCITFLRDNIFYSKILDTFLIATSDKQELLLWGIYSKKNIDLETVIQSLGHLSKDSLLLGFTPKDTARYERKEKPDEDILFIQKNKSDLFEKNKMMFPLLSHA